MMELFVENKTDGKIYYISDICTKVGYSDSLNNGCSKLDFTYIKDGVVFPNGSNVKFIYNKTKIFNGYIFSYEQNPAGEISVVAYDQLRYLKAKDTIVVKDLRLDELIKQIAGKFQLLTGTLDNTGYVLPVSIKDNQTFLDIIYESISNTLVDTGRKYAFYDDFGSITLTDINKMRLPLMLGDQSLVYDFKYSQNIDENTYNLIKIVKDNESTGKRDAYISQDSDSFRKYGILQYFEVAKKEMNPEQIIQKTNALLKLLNAETRTVSIDSLGDTRVRAGTSLLLNISAIGICQYLIVKSVKHSFEKNNHTMNLELML